MVSMVKLTSAELYGCERITSNTQSKIAVFLEILASGSVFDLNRYHAGALLTMDSVVSV